MLPCLLVYLLCHSPLIDRFWLYWKNSDANLLLQWELVNGPDLLDLLNISQSKKLPEATVAHYFQQLVNAVIFMHNNGFCHRDLKLENCVVDTSSQRIKVSCCCSLAGLLCHAPQPMPHSIPSGKWPFAVTLYLFLFADASRISVLQIYCDLPHTCSNGATLQDKGLLPKASAWFLAHALQTLKQCMQVIDFGLSKRLESAMTLG